jgi:HAD superfamily hydrolase (TIGR01509 family)
MVELLEMTEQIEELLAESSEIFYDQLEDRLQPMPGLLELLDHIEACQLPKGVATSSHRQYLEDILGRYDLLARFHMTLSAEDVTYGKPHPEIYLKAAECLGISPEEMLVLEDSEAGTQSAAAANAVVVSVPNQHSKSHDFSLATYVADSLIDPFVLQLLQ